MRHETMAACVVAADVGLRSCQDAADVGDVAAAEVALDTVLEAMDDACAIAAEHIPADRTGLLARQLRDGVAAIGESYSDACQAHTRARAAVHARASAAARAARIAARAR